MEAPTRDQLVTDWVARRFPDQSVQITPASADASFRRYFRLAWPDGSTRILMDAPPDKEDCKPFIHVAGLLAKADLAAPRILDQDLDNGFLVLTDLGRIGYLDALNADLSLADTLMRPVLDALVTWQLSTRASTLPPYDATLLRRELDLKASLADDVGGDIPPRAVLDELIRLGAVELLPDGAVRVAESGISTGVDIRKLREAGVSLIYMSNVDNLGATLDPAILGAHLARGAAITAEVVRGVESARYDFVIVDTAPVMAAEVVESFVPGVPKTL